MSALVLSKLLATQPRSARSQTLFRKITTCELRLTSLFHTLIGVQTLGLPLLLISRCSCCWFVRPPSVVQQRGYLESRVIHSSSKRSSTRSASLGYVYSALHTHVGSCYVIMQHITLAILADGRTSVAVLAPAGLACVLFVQEAVSLA